MVSIKDVAALAGVSIATVSRTLSKPETVAEATRETVLAAVAESGYVTNALARNFRRRRSHTVVVLVPDIGNPFYAEVIQGIETAAATAGYQVLLGDTQGQRSREESYTELVRQKIADGLICLGADIPFSVDGRLTSPGEDWPPLVMASEYDGKIKLPRVIIDNRKAAQEVTEHFLSLGHRKIGYINGPGQLDFCQLRLAGYRDALTQFGISPAKQLEQAGDFTLESGYQAAKTLLTSANPPSAIFCANDGMAIGALHAAHDLNLSIPSTVAIAGFDDINIASFSYPPLTTVRQPRREMGVKSMELMLGLLNEKKVKQTVVLNHELIVRRSTVQ